MRNPASQPQFIKESRNISTTEYSWQKHANRNKNARLGSFSSHNNRTILMKIEYFEQKQIQIRENTLEKSKIFIISQWHDGSYPKLLHVFGDNLILAISHFWQGQNEGIVQNELLQLLNISTAKYHKTYHPKLSQPILNFKRRKQ